MLANPAVASIGATLHWTFDGLQSQEFDILPGQTVTVGLRATWVDTDGVATAFGALVGAEISITGDTGTNQFDVVSNLTRLAPFAFGPASLDGMLVSNADSFLITGVGPGQNQFSDVDWDFGSHTGIMWQFDFTAGAGEPRTIFLDIAGLANALLFPPPLAGAIFVPGELVQTYQGSINVVPEPGVLALLGIGGLAGRRRRQQGC